MTEQETQAMIAAMEKDGKKGGSNFFSLEDGENVIRFLPPLKPNGEVLPYMSHKVHWVDGQPFECLDQSFALKDGTFHAAESCPACKMSKKLYKMGERDSEERELAYAISARDRYIFRIIARAKDAATVATPEFYEVGPAIFKKFLNILKGGKFGNIVHPTSGRDYIVDKQGTGRRTNYDNSMPDPNVTPLFANKEDLKECLTKAVEMKYTDLITFPKAEEIKIAVQEFLDPDSADIGIAKVAAPQEAVARVETVVESKNAPDTDTDDIDDILNEFTN